MNVYDHIYHKEKNISSQKSLTIQKQELGTLECRFPSVYFLSNSKF